MAGMFESSATVKQTRLSVSALHCELRAMFQSKPAHRALVEALARVGEYLGAHYAVVHARLGVRLLSEEWLREGWEPDDGQRTTVNETMADALATGNAKCVRLAGENNEASAVVAAVLHDSDLERAGAAAIVIRDCDRDRALEILSLFEGIIGYLALLAGTLAYRFWTGRWRDIGLVEDEPELV